MDANSIPRNIDNHRSPGEKPAWCLETEAEDTGVDRKTGAQFHTWVRSFSRPGKSWGVDLLAEDVTTLDGTTAYPTTVRVYDPERALSPVEAEEFALAIIDAIKTARDSETGPSNAS